MSIKIAAFSGSLRKASYNLGLLKAVVPMLPEQVSFEILDISGIPLFNQEIEKPAPLTVQDFRQKIAEADALMIATPEYNHSIPGVLKNVLDWGSRSPNVFDRKPLAILGAGGQFGTTRAQYHLRQVAAALNMFPVNVPQVLVYRSWEKFDPDGQLKDDETRKLIEQLLFALIDLTRRLQ